MSENSPADVLAHVESVVRRSGTSFFWAMRRLPPLKRNAMYALYAFCREVDDIADEAGEYEEKISRLESWRKEIDKTYEGQPEWQVSQALLGPVRCFNLAEDDFQAVIDGMEMDAGKSLRLADMDELNLYCDRVACAVGRLSNAIFGIDLQRGNRIADALGRALQLTNILRDLEEDTERDRLYLPASLLRAHGITSDDPVTVLDDPGMAGVFAELAAIAKSNFAMAADELRLCDHRQMRPAIVMMEVYRKIFLKLLRRGWKRGAPPVRLSKVEKLWIVLRHGVF